MKAWHFVEEKNEEAIDLVICAVDINDILDLKRGNKEINLYIF